MDQGFRSVCAFASMAVLVVTSACRLHDQTEGLYLLTVNAPLRDDCHRLTPRAELLRGELVIAGNTVRMKQGPYGMQLVGAYRSNEEQFYVDGTVANLTETLNQRECLLDRLAFHVDAVTDGPESFHGFARIRYEAQADPCICEVWTSYLAVKP